jgi:hypothetical protein
MFISSVLRYLSQYIPLKNYLTFKDLMPGAKQK